MIIWRISGFKKLAEVGLWAGLPAAWGWRLCMTADPSGQDGKLWLGSTIVMTCMVFGAKPLWDSVRMERRAIRREGDLLAIVDKGGKTKRVKVADVSSVALAKVTKGAQGEGGGLVVREAGALRDVSEKADRLRPEGTGIKIRLKSREEVYFGQDLGPKRTEKLLRVLKERFGLPVEGL